ncbi:Uma2 family endonuclease [Streptomyces sp. NPDC021100]|uniref:Uma2 family endonuclease n=1 Tax=Streptomyces sp. NPDC021100 TaxID=3365114 RepID=UPI003787BAA9
MSAAPVEPYGHHVRKPHSLLDAAGEISERFPGYRVEIFGGEIHVAPPADGQHGEVLTDVMLAMAALHRGESRLIQALGMWLPTGEDDYVIPDLALVDADYTEHRLRYNCYDPAVFRLVLEVTSSNHRTDLRDKAALYAEVGVPVYVIVDRRHQRVHVLTEPKDGEYRHTVHAPGSTFTLPESVGAEVELSVDTLLRLKPSGAVD